MVVNRESGPVSRTFQTSLPAGKYCDVQHGDPVNGGCTGPTYTVGQDGRFTATVGAGDATWRNRPFAPVRPGQRW